MNWETCVHEWKTAFGPNLRCQKCGARTMVSMDPKESKPIYPPLGTPISELSGRPGEPGFQKFSDIAKSWGYE